LGLFSGLDATSSYDIATIAGITYAGDSGRATSAWLGSPYGACIEGSNNIWGCPR